MLPIPYPDIILLFLLSSLWIIGFHNAVDYEIKSDWYIAPNGLKVEKPLFEYKEILWWLKYYGTKIIGEYWSKPLWGCPMCMASVHGGVWFVITFHGYGINVVTALTLIMFIVSLSGFMKLIVKKFEI